MDEGFHGIRRLVLDPQSGEKLPLEDRQFRDLTTPGIHTIGQLTIVIEKIGLSEKIKNNLRSFLIKAASRLT